MHIDNVIEWSEEKAEWLKKERGIDMHEVSSIIASRDIIAIETVPNQEAHPDQKMFIISYHEYIHCVPYVYDKCGNLFLKTVFPSRVHQKIYGGKNEKD